MGKAREELYNKRSAIEAKISEAKKMHGLNNSYYKDYEGDKMWAATLSIYILNI
ncbi:MAG: hypothetical protein NTV16_05380 [Actinobacteria bacterium]|nr:hypothetical protein [Actinomycetota bacterium]